MEFGNHNQKTDLLTEIELFKQITIIDTPKTTR